MWNGATWEFDGHAWTSVATTGAPIDPIAMVYDLARARVISFGGFGTVPFVDTWEYDGSSWRQVAPATSPSARGAHAITYDAHLGRMQ